MSASIEQIEPPHLTEIFKKVPQRPPRPPSRPKPDWLQDALTTKTSKSKVELQARRFLGDVFWCIPTKDSAEDDAAASQKKAANAAAAKKDCPLFALRVFILNDDTPTKPLASVYDLREAFISDCNHYCRASPNDLSKLKQFSLKRYTTKPTDIPFFGFASDLQQSILDSDFFVEQNNEITALEKDIRKQIEDIEALAKRIHSKQNDVDQLPTWSRLGCTCDDTHNALSEELRQLKEHLTNRIDQSLKDNFDKLCAAVSAEQLLFVLEMLATARSATADNVHIWLDLGGDVLKALFYKSASIQQHACLPIYTSSSIIYEGLCKFACIRPRQAHKISLCDDENLRATDLIALSAKYAEDPAIFNKFTYSELGERFRRVLKICYVKTGSTAENPNHDRNHIAFTVDYPDAAKPSIGVTVHPLSQCYCRYLVIVCHSGVLTLPVEPHRSYTSDERQPLHRIRLQSANKSFSSVLAALLDEHERLMFDLLRKIEEKRNEIEVRALEEDLNEIDPDDVVKEILSLCLQMVDLVQFFQEKMNTVEFLLDRKKQEIDTTPGKKWTPQLLRSISYSELEKISKSYKNIFQRLHCVQEQIHTIRSNFEALLASHNSKSQEKLTAQINWMSRFTTAALPMNVIAGFFGMNVPVPMQDSDSTGPFWNLLLGSFAVVCFVLVLFATSKKHQWRLPRCCWPSKEEQRQKDDPLKFLKHTRPWFSVYPRAEDFAVDNNVKLLKWQKTVQKVDRHIKKAKEEASKGSLQPTLYAIYCLDKALNKLEQQRPTLKFIDKMPKDVLDSFEKEFASKLNEIKQNMRNYLDKLGEENSGLIDLFFDRRTL